ncbi:MAG: hypothetical protein J6N93_05305 [Clostridia bacterium]|nr:hypothetical protein [Clostridia bacterium]
MNNLFDLNDFNSKLIYKVSQGERISDICDRIGECVYAAIRDNSLTEEVKEYDVLYLEKTSGKLYVVEVGDTIEKICGYDENKIHYFISKNKTDVIFVGQKVYI